MMYDTSVILKWNICQCSVRRSGELTSRHILGCVTKEEASSEFYEKQSSKGKKKKKRYVLFLLRQKENYKLKIKK